MALPCKVIVSPTAKVLVADGEEMTGTGAVLPASMRIVALAWPPRPSLTVSVIVYVPAVEYVCAAVDPVACAEPSPKFQSIGQRIAVGIGAPAPVESHRERGRARRLVGGRDGGRGAVGAAGERDPSDLATVEVVQVVGGLRRPVRVRTSRS